MRAAKLSEDALGLRCLHDSFGDCLRQARPDPSHDRVPFPRRKPCICRLQRTEHCRLDHFRVNWSMRRALRGFLHSLQRRKTGFLAQE